MRDYQTLQSLLMRLQRFDRAFERYYRRVTVAVGRRKLNLVQIYKHLLLHREPLPDPATLRWAVKTTFDDIAIDAIWTPYEEVIVLELWFFGVSEEVLLKLSA